MPSTKAKPMRRFGLVAASWVPILKPMGMKAMETAARKRTRPMNV